MRGCKVTADELGKSLGLTQKQLDERAQQIVAREEAEDKRLETAQKQTAQQVTAVATRCVDREDRRGRRKDRPGQDADRPGRRRSKLTS